MKANYHPKNRSKNTYLRPIFLLVTIFIVGAVLFSFVDQIVISAFSPLWKMENAVVRNFQNGIDLFKSRQRLSEENLVLREKVSSLELQLSAFSSEQTQMITLLELAGRKQTSNTLIAAVLTHPPQTPYDIIIIDAGGEDNLSLGSDVYLPEGHYLGEVSEVFSKKARVKLFSSNGQETRAILERGNIPLTLVGVGGGNFESTVPLNIEVEKGDRILSADISSRILAIVGDIKVGPTDSFKEILAQSPVNIFNLRYVFIVP